MVTDVKPGGTFLLDCAWTPEELDAHLPSKVKKYIANNNISFYIIARRISPPRRSAMSRSRTPSCSPLSSRSPTSCPRQKLSST